MSAPLHRRIPQLFLPAPLEPLLFGVLGSDDPAERLTATVRTWEVFTQIAATSAWATCRKRGLSTEHIAETLAGLRRPSFGHWAEILRECRKLLEEAGGEPAPIAPLVEGLGAPIRELESGDAVRGAFADLSAPLKIQGKTLMDLIWTIPAYRNKAIAHAEVALTATQMDEHATALLAGLVDLAERAPPVGQYRWAVVQRVTQESDDRRIGVRAFHGSHPVSDEVLVASSAVTGVAVGDPVLCGVDDLVALAPLVSASRDDGRWELGLLNTEIRRGVLRYATHTGPTFEGAISCDDYDALFGSRSGAQAARSEPEGDPYRGLLAYGVDDASVFCGRSQEAAGVIRQLEMRGVSVIVGASGSGKSSLMNAGVLARLRDIAHASSEPWVRIAMRPGARPMLALQRAVRDVEMHSIGEATDWEERVSRLLGAPDANPEALAILLGSLVRTGRRVVLAVDQLEEAATVCTDPAERERFLDLLFRTSELAAERGYAVVATIRADLLARLFDHDGIRGVIREHMVALGPIGREQLLQIVLEPLAGRSTSVEDGLPEQIVRDVGDEPGNLALLSQLLTSLWDQRGDHGNRLTKALYRKLGGVGGALRARAEEAWAAIPQEQRPSVERALQRMANISAEGRLVRNRPSIGDVADTMDVPAETVLDALAPLIEGRLLVVGEPDPDPTDAAYTDVTIEVAHEALLRSWPRFEELLRAGQEVIRLRQRLSGASRAHTEGTGDLWTDATANLRRAEELMRSDRLRPTEVERVFLRKSRALVRRRRAIRTSAVVVLLAIAALSIVLFFQAREGIRHAETQRDRAEEIALFLLEDFNDRLDLLDRREIAQDAIDRLYEYYTAREATEGALDPATRQRQSRIVIELAAHAYADGHVEGAIGLTDIWLDNYDEYRGSGDTALWDQMAVEVLILAARSRSTAGVDGFEEDARRAMALSFEVLESDALSSLVESGELNPIVLATGIEVGNAVVNMETDAPIEAIPLYERGLNALTPLIQEGSLEEGVLEEAHEGLAMLEQGIADAYFMSTFGEEAAVHADRVLDHLAHVSSRDAETEVLVARAHRIRGITYMQLSDLVGGMRHSRLALDACDRALYLSAGTLDVQMLDTCAEIVFRFVNAHLGTDDGVIDAQRALTRHDTILDRARSDGAEEPFILRLRAIELQNRIRVAGVAADFDALDDAEASLAEFQGIPDLARWTQRAEQSLSRARGDAFLRVGRPEAAIPYYEAARRLLIVAAEASIAAGVPSRDVQGIVYQDVQYGAALLSIGRWDAVLALRDEALEWRAIAEPHVRAEMDGDATPAQHETLAAFAQLRLDADDVDPNALDDTITELEGLVERLVLQPRTATCLTVGYITRAELALRDGRPMDAEVDLAAVDELVGQSSLWVDLGFLRSFYIDGHGAE